MQVFIKAHTCCLESFFRSLGEVVGIRRTFLSHASVVHMGVAKDKTSLHSAQAEERKPLA
ncbi:hypothetical protein RND71_023559 [Anisodus tanguticus]|uniref:Uncharacterized protein n=1 Tax=Anisodus tanguticus TaxID=243964 RepID=A0AAE1RVE0_9SOLA|nr:hypothetical protein RND71_023559 [Anisodus tanguticus]